MKRRQISPERKALYYAGSILSVIGILLFLSVFVTGAMNIGNFDNFEGQMKSSAFRAIGGMVLIVIGAIVANLGAKGAAGSGIVLDPEKAREDVEPWSRMTGGMIKDGLDEAGINLQGIVDAKVVDSDDGTDFGDKLRELHRLYEEGILSQEEYEREKREILDKI
ncbi:MAG: SHOCT domain-containing protein [Planctomycetia bacterium]|jgi:hypothetical protein